MSDEELRRIPIGKRIFRRRKKFQGATWTPENSPAVVGDGEWCPDCRTRHGYKTMGLTWEKKSTIVDGEYKFKTLWSCPKTGRVIKEWN